MDLAPFVDNLRRELLEAAEPGEATVLAQRLAASVAAATRLTMLEVLSAAAAEISREMADRSVQVRIDGRDPSFVVTREQPSPLKPLEVHETAPPEEGPVSRINFRPPEVLKHRIEAAAGQENLSTNAWLVQVVAAALVNDPRTRRGGRGEHVQGWIG